MHLPFTNHRLLKLKRHLAFMYNIPNIMLFIPVKLNVLFKGVRAECNYWDLMSVAFTSSRTLRTSPIYTRMEKTATYGQFMGYERPLYFKPELSDADEWEASGMSISRKDFSSRSDDCTQRSRAKNARCVVIILILLSVLNLCVLLLMLLVLLLLLLCLEYSLSCSLHTVENSASIVIVSHRILLT